jgi:hypothetical protein
MTQRAQLLEGLEAFGRGRREAGVFPQEAHAVAVDADVAHGRQARRQRFARGGEGVACVRDRRAREVLRESAAVDDDLHDIRVEERGCGLDRVRRGGDRGLGLRCRARRRLPG